MQTLFLCTIILAVLVHIGHISATRPKFTLKGEFTKGSLTVHGSGWTDFGGNWGAGVGIKWKFRKRSAEIPTWNGESFVLVIELDKCNFDVYDENDDGFISSQELHALFFPNRELADLIMQALDSKPGDGQITREEFDMFAPLYIKDCEGRLNKELLHKKLS